MLDAVSENILSLLNSEYYKQREIAVQLNVSLDRVKRVSRIRNLRLAANPHLNDDEFSTLISLGFKALKLSVFVKKEDWEGLSEILQITSNTTTRDELTTLIRALNKKNERISEFKEKVQSEIQILENEDKNLAIAMNEIQTLEKKILEETNYLQKYDMKERDFLLEHLGIYEDKLVLSKRLDSRWQALLKKRGVLLYDEDQYVWHVTDLDAFVKEYSMRVSRKFPTHWEFNREIERDHIYDVPTTPFYKRSSGLVKNLQNDIMEIKKRRCAINKKKNDIKKEIALLKKESPKSFMESVQATDLLSTYNITSVA